MQAVPRRSPLVISPRARAAAFLALAGLVVVVGLVGACNAESVAVGPGGECFLATDCAPGLVCVEQANKTRVCTDDLTRAAGRPPAEAEEAGAPDAESADSSVDGSPPPPPPPPADSGTKDAGRDSGTVDAEPPPVDAGED